ncbi:MAG: hypothetical protein EOP45_00160 [Sphingobacteriaceae bacterium]|nr:MAG: hypothetical protein EOP45_00160 [Sphingobacteriaceae bacterium]
MISNDVHTKIDFDHNKIKSGIDKKMSLTAESKNTICVYSYNMRLHNKSIFLMVPQKDIVSCYKKCTSSFTINSRGNKEYLFDEMRERSSNKSLDPYIPPNPGFAFCKCVNLPHFPSLAYKKIHLSRHSQDQKLRPPVDSSDLFLSIALKTFSTNNCREKVRETKLRSLKNSQDTIWQNNQKFSIKQISQKQSQGNKSDNSLICKEKGGRKGASVWKGFTDILMRHGSKLRYQTVLRKSLLYKS